MARYLMDTEFAAAGALLALVRLARSSREDFVIESLALPDILQAGLVVTGAEERVSKVLARVPGVASEDAVS